MNKILLSLGITIKENWKEKNIYLFTILFYNIWITLDMVKIYLEFVRDAYKNTISCVFSLMEKCDFIYSNFITINFLGAKDSVLCEREKIYISNFNLLF